MIGHENLFDIQARSMAEINHQLSEIESRLGGVPVPLGAARHLLAAIDEIRKSAQCMASALHVIASDAFEAAAAAERKAGTPT